MTGVTALCSGSRRRQGEIVVICRRCRSPGMRVPLRGSDERRTLPPKRRMRGRLRMTTRHANRLGLIGTAALFAFAVSAGPLLAAEDSGSRFPPPSTDQGSQKGKTQKSQKKNKKEQRSQEEVREGYQHARRSEEHTSEL